MDYMERAKREEEAPIIEQAFQQRLVEEQIVHEHEQLKEIELSKQHHAADLQEKNRLARMLHNKVTLQKRIEDRREAEYRRLKEEVEDRINQHKAMRECDREIKQKLLFYIKIEEERQTKIREEEEAQKHEEEERRKKIEAERKAKLDEIAEKQRQRETELDEKERQRREALFTKNADPLPRPADFVTSPHLVETLAAPADGSAPSKYVPRFRREGAAATPPTEQDRRHGHDDRPPQSSDRWRRDDHDRRPTFGGSRSSSSSSWSLSQTRN